MFETTSLKNEKFIVKIHRYTIRKLWTGEAIHWFHMESGYRDNSFIIFVLVRISN